MKTETNKNKFFYHLRVVISAIVAILAVLAFSGYFYELKIFDGQIAALAQRLLIDWSWMAVVLLIGIIAVTLFAGRFYCSVICPLGILQEFMMWIFRRKKATMKNRPCKYWLAIVLWGLLVGGTVALLRFFEPYTIFGSALSGSVWGVSIVALIMVLVWFKGRYFCANICPVGAALGCLSKHSLKQININDDTCVACGLCAANCPSGSIDVKNKKVDNETCVKCLKCLTVCKQNSMFLGSKAKEQVPFSLSRRKFITASAMVAVFAAAIKSGGLLAKSLAERVKNVILPAGAGNPQDFANRCLNCNLCVQNCPMKIIKKADDTYPAIHIDYKSGFCDYECHKCSQVCPSGAIKKISLSEKQNTKIAQAVIYDEVCVKCGSCVMKCPKQAITKVDGDFPKVNFDECIGCGVCKQACPVKAIAIEPVEKQKLL